jgi:Tfp pilus assembly protein FimT
MDHRHAAGFSVTELLAVVFVIGLTASVGMPMLMRAEAPLDSAATLLQGHLRQVRARAMATTSAYRVTRPAANRLGAETAERCSDSDWTAEAGLDLELPQGVTVVESGWTLCFSSRGVADENMILTLEHFGSGQREIEVLLGGTTRLLP